MSTPVVSIVIPCYNHGKYIEETLESIESAKDRYPVEIIIVNDGSTDEYTIEVLKKIEDKGYYVINQKNAGLGNARNKGISEAKGKYILPLDSDNLVLHPYLNDAVDILEKDESYSIVYGDAIFFGDKKGLWKVGPYYLQKILLSNYIDACALYRKSIWESLGGYDPNVPVMGLEDWDFWLRCSFAGYKFYYLEKPCFQYRVLGNSMITQVKKEHYVKIHAYLNDKYKEELTENAQRYNNFNIGRKQNLDNLSDIFSFNVLRMIGMNKIKKVFKK